MDENASLPSDVWNNVTTSSSKDDDDLTQYLANIRNIALKIVYIIIGTVFLSTTPRDWMQRTS